MLMALALICGLAVNTTEVRADERDGFSCETAELLKFNTEYVNTINIDGKYYPHWYEFTTKAADEYYYSLEINKLKTWGTKGYKILDTQGATISAINTEGSTYQYRLKPDSVYYLEVYTASGLSDEDSYAVKIVPIDDPEADTFGKASIELKNGKEQKASIATTYEEDWFWFTANKDEATVTVKKKDVWSIKYSIYDEDGNVLKSESSSAYSSSLTFNTVKGKKYYVDVYTNNNGFNNFAYGLVEDINYTVTVDNGAAEMPEKPVCMFAGTKVIAGKALPGATVKCTYNKKTYSATANDFGLYVINLKGALKKNAKVQIWQIVGGSTSKKNSVKVSE